MFIPADLYKKILPVMPIPCVDILVVDQAECVLLVKRKNEPAKGQWWLPGGRILMGETRAAAAVRKLREETGLIADERSLVEMATEDLLLPDGQGGTSHTIATIYRVDVGRNPCVVLDGQSDGYDWRARDAWLAYDIHPYVRGIIRREI